MADSYDAVVIGGGVIGTATLFNLMRLGCRRALLLERGELAGGATAKSSGIVRTHYSVAPNVAIAGASLRMFDQFSGLLDDPEADAGWYGRATSLWRRRATRHRPSSRAVYSTVSKRWRGTLG